MSEIWWRQPVASVNQPVYQQALERQNQLTKPPGSLGRLEALAARLAAMQGTQQPELDKIAIVVFAADHGVAQEGVSVFPQVVTTEMIRNFARGGAAISVLARELGASLEVVDMGAVTDPGPLPGVVSKRVAAGTANFRHTPAMTAEQLTAALEAGREAVERAMAAGAQLFIAGEMGIANTTAATAIASVLLGQPAATLTGPGTGLSADGVSHKAQVIHAALQRHALAQDDPLEALRCVGGFEIAAMVGAYVYAAQRGLPVLVDGFISTAAALVAVSLSAGVADWLLYSHRSAEPGVVAMHEALGVRPLLDLGMRLGEGSGAALAVPVLRLAAALHGKMATFADAGVSEKTTGPQTETHALHAD